jgi:hypothetical protein
VLFFIGYWPRYLTVHWPYFIFPPILPNKCGKFWKSTKWYKQHRTVSIETIYNPQLTLLKPYGTLPFIGEAVQTLRAYSAKRGALATSKITRIHDFFNSLRFAYKRGKNCSANSIDKA